MNKKLLLMAFSGLMLVSIVFGKTVRVATYNVENYLHMDRRVHGSFKKDYPKPEYEKTEVRKVIRSVNPDILAIQEIGGKEYLEELRDDLAKEGLEYEYMMLVEGPDRVRHVGLLSKEPIIEEQHHEQMPFWTKQDHGREKKRVVRGLLEATFNTEGQEWKLYTTHLKSKVRDTKQDPGNDKFRIQEVDAIRQRVREDYPKGTGGKYVILGDLNDGPRSKVLKRLKKMGKEKFSIPLEAEDSRGEIWTEHSNYQGAYYRLDYICVSPELFEFVQNKRASIYDAPGLLKGSDHRMVYMDLDF